MKTTRKLILEYLSGKPSASAVEISHALRVTPANIRHHLAVLLDEGVVQVSGQRPPGGRGRPIHLYTLTSHAQEHNLDKLASALLGEFLADLPEKELEVGLERLASRLSQLTTSPQGSLTQRLYAAIHRLNQLRYQARWEARSDAPRVIFGHCPYASILPEHPELCLMDGKLLEELLNTPVRQTARLARTPRGEIYCAFILLKSVVRELSVKT